LCRIGPTSFSPLRECCTSTANPRMTRWRQRTGSATVSVCAPRSFLVGESCNLRRQTGPLSCSRSQPQIPPVWIWNVSPPPRGPSKKSAPAGLLHLPHWRRRQRLHGPRRIRVGSSHSLLQQGLPLCPFSSESSISRQSYSSLLARPSGPLFAGFWRDTVLTPSYSPSAPL